MLCSKCGTLNESDYRFCKNCGESFALDDPDSEVYNVFSQWVASIQGDFSAIFGAGFTTAEEALEALNSLPKENLKEFDMAIGKFDPTTAFEGVILVSDWREVWLSTEVGQYVMNDPDDAHLIQVRNLE